MARYRVVQQGPKVRQGGATAVCLPGFNHQSVRTESTAHNAFTSLHA